MPKGAREALDEILRIDGLETDRAVNRAMGVESMGPFISRRLGIYNGKQGVQASY